MFMELIIKAREERGLSMLDCAYSANFSSYTVWHKYETGERFPKIDRAKEMCRAVGLSWSKLKPIYEEDKRLRKIKRLKEKIKGLK